MRKYILPILLGLIIFTSCGPEELLEEPPTYQVIYDQDQNIDYSVKD